MLYVGVLVVGLVGLGGRSETKNYKQQMLTRSLKTLVFELLKSFQKLTKYFKSFRSF